MYLHGGANGYYSPIVGSPITGFEAQAEYYGLMLAQSFAGSTLHKATLDAQGANVTAYAASAEHGGVLIAIFNKDARDAEVNIDAGAGWKQAVVERLEAPAVDSKTGVTFDSAAVGSDGQFRPSAGKALSAHAGKLSVRVAGYSAALLRSK